MRICPPYSGRDMETQVEEVDGVQIVHPHGRLDLTKVAEFSALLQGLIEAGNTKIVLDCRNLEYISSAGLGAFVAAAKKLGPDHKLVFASFKQSVRNVFDMTGVANLFQICNSMEEALEQFAGL